MISFSLYFSRFLKNYDLRKNKAKNQSKLETNLILINFSHIFFAVFLVKFPKFFTKIKHVAVLWKKMICEKAKRKINQKRVKFWLQCIFRFAFSLRKFGKFFKTIAIFRVWQSCIFHFSRRREISRARNLHQISQVPVDFI